MGSKPLQKREDSQLFQSVANFASYQPFVGMINSVVSAFFLLLRDKPWGWWMIAYTFIPFIGFTAIYAIIAIYAKLSYNINIPFVHKKVRNIMVVFILLFVGLNIALWWNAS
ncbi:hypothetical protein EDD70_2771 [Hydrogenoanaerobacterium saccharovorans]|uniref:Uncharacterized protein n=1 Tax=Hydrogenoanaerobacterium saccharovorans TaxID=474960 RepID=A0A1H8EEM5_9FIRM|nr:hypothetical protein [Hydrogenoanaerobacterium saccharovorans]RPF42029.1 hypothetical protein EDD70_2771 [Hydrogenoanaerobacterium saccharovorans]SEN17208.1 hypothetical protein SAMN05216180_2976 [Hydrogenoanaerobacterium saccharovorans]